VADESILGTRLPRVDGPAKASGEFVFPTDVTVPGMLVGKILRSPHPHALIKGIDTTAARAIEGVFAVVTAKDFTMRVYGQDIADETVLATDKVRFIGDEVAGVAAIDGAAAEKALAAIRVDYEVLPALLAPKEALEAARAAKPVVVHQAKPNNIAMEYHINRGDIEAGLKESVHVSDATYETPRIHQAYMESNCCVAHWQPDRKLTLWPSTQWPSRSREDIAEVLGLEVSQVRVIQNGIGGGFGGKFCPKNALLASVLTMACGRPVRLENTLAEDFEAARPFVATQIRIKTGVRADGTIAARQLETVVDNGPYSASGAGCLSVASSRGNNLYRMQNVKSDGVLVYTNLVPTGAYRGYGNQALAFAAESEMDRIARAMNWDPADFRKNLATRTGDVTVDGWRIGSAALVECIDWAVKASDYHNRRPAEGPVRYGKGMACGTHVSGNIVSYKHWDGSGAIIKLDRDGKAHLFTSEPDIGQGSYTALVQIAAEAIGVNCADVAVHENDTDITPFGVGATGSHITTVGGNAVKNAGQNARRELLAWAGRMVNLTPDNLDLRAGQFYLKAQPDKPVLTVAEVASDYYVKNYIPLYVTGTYRTPGYTDKATKYGSPSPAYSFAGHVAEVAVDMETGRVRVLNYWAAHDVGKAINKMALEGQIEGGVAQGIGFALTEEMHIEGGKVQNGDFLDYKCPVAGDMPNIYSHFVEPIDPLGPFGAKGIGELAFVPVAAAIANAVADATGVRFTRLPITPFRVVEGIKNQRL
jgi:CO/xanthine dehydrogenase Mo-binding subunit